MQALTSKAKQVERKPMTFWEKLYIPAIAKGMAITFGHIFKKKPTINYPEQTRALYGLRFMRRCLSR
jgi:NADH-quinone oxidoreductase subunit I